MQMCTRLLKVNCGQCPLMHLLSSSLTTSHQVQVRFITETQRCIDRGRHLQPLTWSSTNVQEGGIALPPKKIMNLAAKYACFIAGYKVGRLKGWQNQKNVITITSFFRKTYTQKDIWKIITLPLIYTNITMDVKATMLFSVKRREQERSEHLSGEGGGIHTVSHPILSRLSRRQ